MFFLFFLNFLCFFVCESFPIYCPASTEGLSKLFFGPSQQNNEKAWLAWFSEAQSWKSQLLQNISYKNPFYDNNEFKWTRSNYISPQIQATDLFLYNSTSNKFTLDKFISDIQTRCGQIDSVLFWPAYPNMGIDNRNQFDWLASVPGGLKALSSLVQQFRSSRSLKDVTITDCYRGEIWASVLETNLLSMEIQTFGFACFFNFLRILNFLLNNFLMK